MSMEVFALSDRRLASLVEWQEAIDAAGLDLVLPSDTSIEDLHGFLPVRSGDVATGFECDHNAAREVMETYSEIDFGRTWAFALAFNVHGFDEIIAAYLAAAAYAKAADGVVFDPQEGLVMSPQRAFEVADQMKADLPRLKELLRTLAMKRAP